MTFSLCSQNTPSPSLGAGKSCVAQDSAYRDFRVFFSLFVAVGRFQMDITSLPVYASDCCPLESPALGESSTDSMALREVPLEMDLDEASVYF